MALVVRKDPTAEQTTTLLIVDISLPSPFLNLDLIRNLFSWTERFSFTYQQAFSAGEILPLSALTLFKEPAFAKVAAILDQLAQDALANPEENGSAALTLEELRVITQDRIILDGAIQARVECQKELQKKALEITHLKEQAFILYFSHGGRETKQKIDEAMVTGAFGVLNPQDKNILDLYWRAAAAHPWGAEWHQVFEKGIYDFFTKALQEGYALMASLQNPQFKKLYGFFMKKALHKSIKKVVQQWLLRCKEIKLEQDQIKIHYMILKGRSWEMPLIRHRLKQILGPLIFKSEDAILNLARQKEKQIQKEIAERLEELNSPSCCIDPEFVKNESSFPWPEGLVEYRLNANKDQRERCLKGLSELQAFTFEDCLKWACQEWGYNSLELKSVLAEETPFDPRVLEVLTLTSIIEDPDDLERDLQLDLTALSNPIAFFVERFKARDAQALALLTGKVEEI